jgi:hypothetical protein
MEKIVLTLPEQLSIRETGREFYFNQLGRHHLPDMVDGNYFGGTHTGPIPANALSNRSGQSPT